MLASVTLSDVVNVAITWASRTVLCLELLESGARAASYAAWAFSSGRCVVVEYKPRLSSGHDVRRYMNFGHKVSMGVLLFRVGIYRLQGLQMIASGTIID